MIALHFGDSITFENEPTKYRISELMYDKRNIVFANNDELVTVRQDER